MTALTPDARPTDAQPQTTRARVALRWALAVAVAVFIFYMSSRTAGQLGGGFMGQLKQQLNLAINTMLGTAGDPMSVVAHFSEYLVLGLALVNALRSHMGLGRACACAIALASAYAVTDEIHQIFVPGRYCDPADWLTDTLGASCGCGIYALAHALQSKRNKRQA